MNDGSAPWIKIITRLFEDSKIVALAQLPEGDSVVLCWFRLLCLAGEQNRGGMIYLSESVAFTSGILASKWRCRPATVELALAMFQKFGMISIDQEGTISVLNWCRYQNEEGLAQIRERSLNQLQDRSLESVEERRAQKRKRDTERQRKCRQNRQENGSVTRSGAVTRDGGVTPRDGGVTVTLQRDEAHRETVTSQTKIENKNENKRENENKENSLSVSESNQSELIQHAEAKRLFGKLSDDVFGEPLHESQWPNDMEHWLDEALPISRESWKLIDWFYRLPLDHEIFKVTRRRQSMGTLMENLRSELQKIRSARRTIGLNRIEPVKAKVKRDEIPPEWAAAIRQRYGSDVPIPPLKSQLPLSVRAEIEAIVDLQSNSDQKVRNDVSHS